MEVIIDSLSKCTEKKSFMEVVTVFENNESLQFKMKVPFVVIFGT